MSPTPICGTLDSHLFKSWVQFLLAKAMAVLLVQYCTASRHAPVFSQTSAVNFAFFNRHLNPKRNGPHHVSFARFEDQGQGPHSLVSQLPANLRMDIATPYIPRVVSFDKNSDWSESQIGAQLPPLSNTCSRPLFFLG